MALTATPNNISIVGLKKETTQGTEAAGDYRGLLVENFTAEQEVDRGQYSLIAGYKGAYSKNNSGSHVNISFRTYAGTSDADQATLLDLVYMALDVDTVTGADPYTHTFTQTGAVVAKNSWSIYHDDGKSNYRVFTGFVLDSINVVCDRSQGVIPIEVTGMAWQEAADTSKTVDFAANYNIYTPNTAKLTLGGTQMDNWTTATLNITCGTRVFHGINDTGYPSNIDGQDLRATLALEGEWNEAAGQKSDTIRDAWLAGTTITDDLVLLFGTTAASDYFTLTFRHWELETQMAKNLERDAMLPQSLTAYPTWEGDIANKYWDIAINSLFNTNAGSL